MIKYLGSKRRLVPLLGAVASAVGAQTALDLFTGTTRVAQEFKRRGVITTAVDLTRYSAVLAETYIGTDARDVNVTDLQAEIDRLNALPGRDGYVTETFCHRSRYFQPHNGRRIDAIRATIEADHLGTPAHSILLTALLLAADRVDSTTGVQMAYLKSWAPRSYRDLELRIPLLLPGPGVAMRSEAHRAVATLPRVDLAYLDPPYNQHRYEANYHIWDTLVRGDEPDHYGVACKRVDIRDDPSRSAFNRRATMPGALRQVIADVRAETVVVSYNDESWVDLSDLIGWCGRDREAVTALGVASRRYVGARIGVHNPAGERVGQVGRLENMEYVLVASSAERVRAAVTQARGAMPEVVVLHESVPA